MMYVSYGTYGTYYLSLELVEIGLCVVWFVVYIAYHHILFVYIYICVWSMYRMELYLSLEIELCT